MSMAETMKRYSFVIMLLFIVRIGFAADVINDSPEKQSEKSTGIRKVDSLLLMTYLNISDSSSKAMSYCLQASELAIQLNYKHGEALAAYYAGKG
jgi:hypothetical protein